MKKNSIIKQLICLICFLCLSQVLSAESMLVRVINNQGIIYDAGIGVSGPGNIISTKHRNSAFPIIFPFVKTE